MSELTLTQARRIVQGLFLALFLFLFIQTESKGADELGWPVRLFLDFDPLIFLTTFLSSHRVEGLFWLSLILAGLTVIASVLERLDAGSVTVSAYGLREGLLWEMIGASTATAPAVDPMRLVREFADRCRTDRRHVEQVRLLALSLFDQIGEAVGCTPEERHILEAASILHDVGQLVSYKSHHRHSYQLIMHADRIGLGARERSLVALVSRYHRRRGPKRSDPEFAALSPDDQALVRRTAGLLRVADGLDRGHTAVVDQVRAELTRKKLVLRIAPRRAGANMELEGWAARRKADVLQKVLGRKITINASLALAEKPAAGERSRVTPRKAPRRS